MPRTLGYGGLANTNGARDFSGKQETVFTAQTPRKALMGVGFLLNMIGAK